MSEEQTLTLAVVAEDSLQQHRIRSAIEHFGCNVLCLSPSTLELRGMDSNVAAWLVDLRDDDALLDRFLELDAPVLLGFEAAPSPQDKAYPKWEKRLYAKLKQLLGLDLIQSDSRTQASISALKQLADLKQSREDESHSSLNDSENLEPAENIWVLGSSLGGPEAVKEFIDALPEGLPVAFIYGQHIDAQFVPVLAQGLARHSHFTLKVAGNGMTLHHGQILIVPTENEVCFVNESVRVMPQPWPGPYGPSVDQLILNTYKAFNHAGVILFSGMGNDGADALTVLKEQDIEIWAQSSDTCASAAMPDASRETGAVKFSGSPTELAEKLVQHIQKKEALASMDS